MEELNGKVAVVTGASSGIGRATALALGAEGCSLALCDVKDAGLDETAELARAAGVHSVTTHHVDVSDKAQMADFAGTVVEKHGAAHIVVNNAGVTVMASFEEQSIEDMEWILGINLWGVIYGCKFFLPHLRRAGEGHIVNISSAFGIIAPAFQTTYVASKFAVRGMSASLRAELKEHNIGVTSVHPGAIQTNIVRDARILNPTEERMRTKTQSDFDRMGTSPEVVARRIVQAIKRNQGRLLVTKETYLADIATRLMPNTASKLVDKLSKRARD